MEPMRTQTELMALSGVIKRYPVTGGLLKRQIGSVYVLNGVDLTIGNGEITGLVGESGCGKTTLAKLMIKLEEPTYGKITFNGELLAEFKGARKKEYYRRVQMVFQDPFSSLNPRLRVKNIIGEMARVQGDSREQSLRKTKDILGQVGLDEDALDRYPHEFSGGQRQRIAIARALVVKPQLLIADEPVSALDLSLQAKTLELLKSLKTKYNLTIFMISHDLRKVSRFCQTVAVMYLGRIVEIIPGDRLLKDCRHPYTEALINSMPVTDPAEKKLKINVIEGEVPSPLDLPQGCAFYQRCSKRMPQCMDQVPQLKEIDDRGHHVACFLLDC